MICIAEDIRALRELCTDSPFGCQILSAANAYGLERPFAQFWTDRGAAYSKLDSVMCICGTITDAQEARAFVHAIGAEQVICSAENAVLLELKCEQRGVIMFKDVPDEEAQAEKADVSMKELYNVLNACEMVGEFEPFYLDASHRTRHNTAVAVGLTSISGDTAAVGFAQRGEACSLITAVAVRPEYRRMGFGTRITALMERKLRGRIYLLRAENENEEFYASMGYSACGIWCTGALK